MIRRGSRAGLDKTVRQNDAPWQAGCIAAMASQSEVIPMSEHVYRITEVVGSSEQGVDDAVRRAIARATETIRNVRWFQVCEIRGQVAEDAIHYWQVTVKIGFTLE
jgi:flavin-binding protein dodecin